MKLKRLAINRLPGVDQPFEIEAGHGGFHVVFGPNAIGKSSLCRAVEALYWQDGGPSQQTSVVGEFDIDGDAWWAEREGARVRWQRGGENSAPPILPGSHNRRCFFLRLRDLIDPSPDGTHDIASEIRRQMSGGFDLDHIASKLFTGITAQRARRDRSEFNSASEKVERAQGEHAGLLQRADQLDALREQLARADAGARRLVSVERALGLARRLDEYTQITEEMAALPHGLTKLSGKEIEQVDELQHRLDTLSGRARELEEERHAALEAKRNAQLDIPLDDAALAVQRGNADELSRVELTLETAQTERKACQNALNAALEALGGGDPSTASLDTAKHGQLFEFLRAVEQHRSRVKAIKEQLRLLEHVDRDDGSEHDTQKTKKAVDDLRAWLRAPEPESFSDRMRARRYWILFAVAAVVAGAVLAVFVDPMLSFVAAVGLGIAVPVIALRNPAASSGARESARNEFTRLGIKEPDTWDIASVEMRLRELEDEIALLDAREQRVVIRQTERQKLQSELEGLAEAESGINARRRNLADSLNLDDIPPDAELVDLARALDQFRSSLIASESAAGKVDALEAQQAELLAELTEFLEHHGEARPGNAKTAAAYLNRLATRNSQLVNALAAEKRAVAQLNVMATDRSEAFDALKRIYSEVGLEDGDLPGLRALLESLPHYLQLKSDATRLEAQIALDRDALSDAGEAALAESDIATLIALKRELSRAAEEAPNLRNEIADISSQVAATKRSSKLQELIAAREEARAKLAERREEALFAQAGKFLIDAVEEEYEQTQMPRVLERARDHFSTFTHHKYELRLSREASAPQLFAVELQSGEGRRLDELSDGTRAQLLLAARIAFAEEVEQGKVLPLFLDEALDQTDPARFEAIVRSLGQIANDQDRQIFYLTSDPSDVERIRRALAVDHHEVAAAMDLGQIRLNAVSVGGPGALDVPVRPAVPEPTGLSAMEYGVKLGVPFFQPALGHAAQHFFYVLSDDLDQLRALLVHHIERVGQWRTVATSGLAERLGSDQISAAQITARTELLEVFCELWKQGRGRPVDREALENSNALTSRYLDDVVKIGAELAWDPERLLTYLETGKDPRLKGFRKASIEGLEQYLRDEGYLVDQPILDESGLRLLALASPAANHLPNGVAGDLIHRWWTLSQRMTSTPGSGARPSDLSGSA